MNHTLSTTFILTLILLGTPLAQANLTVENLRCEYQQNPIAIDTPQPRLSWILTSPERNQKQTAYQILVASRTEILGQNDADLWDSGKVESDRSLQIPYAGKTLTSFQDCFWKVRVWDKTGKPSGWSQTASWRMGIMSDSEWNARWIGAILSEESDGTSPLPIFRRDFKVEKTIKQAYVSICGLGFYELCLNGEKIGGSMFDPGWTNYRKTCLYATYDITEKVKQGGNALGVMLGNGMYNVPGGRYIKFKGSFGEPKFILHAQLEYADGTVEPIVSDQSWRSAPGPITFSCIFGGEDYDARLERPGWDTDAFDDSDWSPASVCQGPGGVLKSQSADPIRVIREMQPLQVTEPEPGVKVFDLGQNFSGVPSIRVEGKRGSSLKITPAELLNASGTVNQSASGHPHYYTYTLNGHGIESWCPRFTYYGFRYIQIESPGAEPPNLLSVSGLFTRNSANRVGAFECSSSLYNEIHQLIDWSVGSNFQSVLTDCPHREKLGWLEVAHLMAPSIAFNYDVPRFYAKVTQDIRDSQLDNGLIPDIAPEYAVFSGGFRDSPEWGSAGVILPWFLYQWFDDRRALQENYPAMKCYVDYLSSLAVNHIVSHGLGDWFDYVRGGSVGPSQLTPKSLTATAMYYHDTVLLGQAAAILGNGNDVIVYSELASEIRGAFNTLLFDHETKQYATGSQTANSIPLVWDLVDENDRAAVVQNLTDEVERRGYLTAGDVGFRFLIRALAGNGRSDLVYRLTHRTGEPGYGYQIEQGATSLTEAWDGRRVVSHNHCMLGHLQEWLHQELAGIQRDPTARACKKIIIHPNPVGDITWIKSHYDSPYGRISCQWKLFNQQFTLKISIPANTRATVWVPTLDIDRIEESGKPATQNEGITLLEKHDNCAVYQVGSGNYTFTSPYSN